MLKPTITTTGDLPVTLAQVKEHAVVDFGDDDVLLDSYIRAALAWMDGPAGVLGRPMMPQTVVQPLDCLQAHIRLPYGPASALTSVEFFDADNVAQTFTGFSLLTDETGSFIWTNADLPQTYERPDAVTVTYQAGYADQASVPENLKLAISMLAASWYCQREDMSEKSMSSQPFGVRQLIAPYRTVGI